MKEKWLGQVRLLWAQAEVSFALDRVGLAKG